MKARGKAERGREGGRGEAGMEERGSGNGREDCGEVIR